MEKGLAEDETLLQWNRSSLCLEAQQEAGSSLVHFRQGVSPQNLECCRNRIIVRLKVLPSPVWPEMCGQHMGLWLGGDTHTHTQRDATYGA